MPWWIWLLLALLMLAVLVMGVVYAFRRANAALKLLGSFGSAVNQRLDPARTEAKGRPAQDPSFTDSVSVSAGRYADAHARLLKRKDAAHRNHLERWAAWRSFNQ
ncbi:hypothetical protein [Bifidobacterium xylocopae]|uniref:Uncharacterized protein n=1 Tax=Bifidobacterium xylocopae TaxID=2493119 RepID=A0A366KDG8_9BIFI|nr:hypothetical protein [Bifidobacterium xylocopae]RBP99272.1 hypothetical protein CRD59_04395 [Bifidobacterium xylocopae]